MTYALATPDYRQPVTQHGPAQTSYAESVDASLSYIDARAAKPIIDVLGAGLRHETNARFVAYPVEITNGRRRQNLSLDREGFTLTRHDTSVVDFDNDDEVKHTYYDEMEALLKRETGASEVHVFDHNVRRDTGDAAKDRGAAKPVYRVHNDFTASSGPRRVKELVGTQTDRDVAVVNVWRPITGPLQSAPLALADAVSVAPRDLIAADLVYADRTGEIYYGAWSPAHRWVYFPDMEADEALLIKGYDSRTDGRARFTLHTAFDDPTTPVDALPRESIEIRALVFFDQP